ncbi:hypothetical protein NE237_008152 [Protea cynaroides]|uniref:Uncharacterized protein n=1 Tax=Protea cynaroides TaxID=273540 RepID=A0A9Q0KQI9_9MAGN|nr:hypothetical protein NE237_008152 [Protea cynaroides]
MHDLARSIYGTEFMLVKDCDKVEPKIETCYLSFVGSRAAIPETFCIMKKTLKLLGNVLNRLPKEMRQMINLRHQEFNKDHLLSSPEGTKSEASRWGLPSNGSPHPWEHNLLIGWYLISLSSEHLPVIN